MYGALIGCRTASKTGYICHLPGSCERESESTPEITTAPCQKKGREGPRGVRVGSREQTKVGKGEDHDDIYTAGTSQHSIIMYKVHFA